LIGAGPGHPDFLTVVGARLLSQADVVIYDALLSPAFQEHFPPKATRYFVGKRCGEQAMPQAEIHALMIREAQAGQIVVRLQGGDPTLFGRLGEEMVALRAAGVAFTVIPGVSSLTAAAGRAGLPLTLRGVSRQVLVLDGHTIQTTGFDFKSLVVFQGTLVVMMGAGVVSVLVEGLLAAGMDGDTPIALVESATFAEERVQRSTLFQASKDGLARAGSGPGILYVGQVAGKNLAPAINFRL
jgi:uroporphyrin-III C-methyltransferase